VAPTEVTPCTLSYPEKFYKAVSFVSDPKTDLSHESRLLLYGLHKQATLGPCKEGKPWGWNVVEAAKYQSWKGLGNMSEVEAMR
jgi:acyl-CoA-binding protein